MNILKFSAIAISSALVFGCGGGGSEGGSTSTTGRLGTFTTLLEDGYWEFGSAISASEDDLPNVYVLKGSTITYYYDDDDLGTYTAYPVSFDDDSAGHFTFDFYENTNTPTETTVLYSLSDGVLTLVTDTDELVDYEDHAGDSDVINAIAAVGSSVSAGGSTPVDTEVSSEDFESYSLGAILTAPWEVNYVDGTASSANLVADDASDGSQSIELYDGETDTKPNVILHFSDPVTSGSMSFYMKVPSGNEQACYAAMTTSKYYSARFMEMKVTASGSVYYEADTDVKIGTVSTNVWHRYDISWTDTTFSISVDNKTLVSDITQASTGLYGTAPSEVKFMAGNEADINTTCYFDDVEFVLPKS